MDNLTHLGVGALCAVGVVKASRVYRARQHAEHTSCAANSPKPLPATWVVLLTGAIAGNFPDIDFITYFIDPLYYDAYWHRGATHSFILAPLWTAALAFVLWSTLWRRRHFAVLYCICLAGIVSHILVDVMTSWPTSIWYPISATRHALGFIFIIDLFVTGMVFLALWAALTRRRTLLATSLTVALAYPVFAFTQQQRALNLPATEQHSDLRAWAQPFSVFHWKVVAPVEQGFDVMYVRLSGRSPVPWPFQWMRHAIAGYSPVNQADWQTQLTTPDAESLSAWQHDAMYAVRDFMTHPVLYARDEDCIWFNDMLFALPELSTPFVYGICETATEVRIERQPNQAPWAG